MDEAFFKLFRERFESTMKQKTSWGRNEVMAAFESCVSNAALERLQQMAEEKGE